MAKDPCEREREFLKNEDSTWERIMRLIKIDSCLPIMTNIMYSGQELSPRD